ncbi:NHL domain-containing thioredoxin family protein [Phytomonospora sp. NPDC050363]|uniref:NHL domain-containing thioredoxin family protein n=1 Tax=Phytomonospora sp. NPDC050363 TaxID=3155642 RepID=UPI0033D5C126
MNAAPTPPPQARVRAPELTGRGWLNTGGKDLRLADLRGKIVLLDFWTTCCVNCLHVLDELRPLEHKYADVLVTVGVHSPKFEHERDAATVAAAVERYEVGHPVLDDPDLTTWKQYAARAWPTLSVVDPEGYVVASMAGEGHAEGLDRLIAKLVAEHEERGTLHRGDGPYVPPPPAEGVLRFPGKALLLPSGNLLVSDSARHRLVELLPDAETLVRVIGTGERGRADGPADAATFSEPAGMALLPEHLAGEVGYDLVVADTVNHLLRGVRLADGEVTTIAGSGRQWRGTVDFHAHDSIAVDLSSPWDVVWHGDRVIVAMAGIHQLWWLDPLRRTAGVWAGTTVESLKDGPLPEVFLSQPSGVASEGRRLWFADSETSALRYVEDDVMGTAVGQGLFDFGHVDGKAADALLQHPLGLCVLPDGSIAIADTYNGAVRRYDPSTGEVSTVARDLAEPSDVLYADGRLLVVESAAHRIVAVPLADEVVAGKRHQVKREPMPLAPGALSFTVVYEPPPGQKLDDTFGPPTRLEVTADPPELLVEGAGVGTDLTRELILSPDVAGGVLQVVAQAASCDSDVENAACHLTRQDWGVPVRVEAGAPAELSLILRG